MPPPLSDQALAEAVTRRIWAGDAASHALGIAIGHVGPGTATLTMTVTPAMANGIGICHGGCLFTLADAAFALACNSRNQVTVAQHCAIDYLEPAQVGDRLTAVATERARRGRSGIYDVRITGPGGATVAEFRGQSRSLGATHLPPDG